MTNRATYSGNEKGIVQTEEQPKGKAAPLMARLRIAAKAFVAITKGATVIYNVTLPLARKLQITENGSLLVDVTFVHWGLPPPIVEFGPVKAGSPTENQ